MASTPECPRHHLPMVKATHWVKLNDRPFPKPIHTCIMRGCLIVHDDVQGFYKASKGEPIGHSIPSAIHRMKSSFRVRL
jgi:hypothetical protein